MNEKRKHHHHHHKESEESKLKRRNLNARRRRKAFAKVLFTFLCIVATLIVVFTVWAYTN